MSNYFGMVNTKNSSIYTYHAVESFFSRTHFDCSRGDRFYLIDNDNSLLRLPENCNGKVTVVKNQEPQCSIPRQADIPKVLFSAFAR
jgi:hypothetical protein